MPQPENSAKIQAQFERAIDLHRRGRLADAQQIYQMIVASNPRHADAMHYLGVIAHQNKKHEIAVELISKAIEINGSEAAYFANLALALKAAGKVEPALAALNDAIRINPRLANAHFQAGLLLKLIGKLPEAIAAFRDTIQIDPTMAEAHFFLGAALCDVGNTDEAVEAYTTSILLKPDFSTAHSNLAAALIDLGHHAEALDACNTAIGIKPDFAGAYHNRGVAHFALRRFQNAADDFQAALGFEPDLSDTYSQLGLTLKILGRSEEAVSACTKAVNIKPDFAQGHFNLGIPLFDLNRFEEALAACDKAIALQPDFAEAHSNRGIALRELGRFDESLSAFADALALMPDYANAHFNESLTLLLCGDFAKGLPKYEWRYRGGANDLTVRQFVQPQWRGEDVKGLTVLLHAEQGLGDTIQFSRYIPMVAARGAKIIFEAPRHLHRIMARLPGVDQFVAFGDPLPPFDLHCPLMSLAHAFHTDLDSVPPPNTYLHVEPEVCEKWKARLGANGFKIGITWQGSPTALAERGRSAPLDRFEALSKIPGVRLISLQKGHGIDQLQSLPPGMQVEMLGADFDDGPDAFIDTAAVMMSLDLVITVDTAIGHLAGTLKRPVWLALQKVPHWIWMTERADSPWYPGTRLFRQRERGNWDELFSRMALELSARVAET